MSNCKNSNSEPTKRQLMDLASGRTCRQSKIVNYNESGTRAPSKRKQEGPKEGTSSKKPAGVAKGSSASDAPSTSRDPKIPSRQPLLSEAEFDRLKAKFRQQIQKFRKAGKNMGCPEFMEFFVKNEFLLDTYENYCKSEPAVKIVQDGSHYLRDLESFDGPILFKKSKGLGLEFSDEVNVENLEKLLGEQKSLNVICSFTQITKAMPVKKFLEFFKKDSRKEALNVISLEVSKLKKLAKEIRAPKYVERFGIINQLKTALKAEFQRQDRLYLESKSPEIQKNLKFLEKMISELPTYQKFLVLSTKGSFTDAHIDLSATATFFHVKTGKKVFYIAPPTEKNLEIYEKVEKEEIKEWIGDTLWDQWIRVEISAGQTAMIPSGWIHFVWTLEDTIAVSGSYLLEKYVPTHFRITKLDEYCLQNQKSGITMDHMFQGFHPVMWAYVKYILLPDIADRSVSSEKLKIVKCFAENLEPRDKLDKQWFNKAEQSEILKKLKSEVRRLQNQ